MLMYFAASAIYLLYLSVFWLVVKRDGGCLVGKSAPAFSLALLLNFFILILPGVLIQWAELFPTVLSHGALKIPKGILVEAANHFLFSQALFLLTILWLSLLSKNKYKSLGVGDLNRRPPLVWLIGMVLGLTTYYFYAVGLTTTPAYLLLTEGTVQAKLAKADFLLAQNHGRPPELIFQFIRFILPLSVFLIWQRYILSPSKRNFILLFQVVACAALFFLHDYQKAPIFILILGLVWIYVFYKGIKTKIILAGAGLVFLLAAYNAMHLGLGKNDIAGGIDALFNRLFILQIQGYFYIYWLFEPDPQLIYRGALFSSYIFENLPPRADSVVMEVMYGKSDANVNMNSYYLAEAYSSMGMYGIYLSPFFMGLYCFLVNRFFVFISWTSRVSELTLPLSLTFFLFFFPISQGFNSFLWLRNVVIFLFFSAIVLVAWRVRSARVY